MGLINRFWWVPFGRVPEISASELHTRLTTDSPPQVLDVRTALEWKTSRISGSMNVPITQLPDQLDRLGLDPQRPVVTICLSAHRSIPAVRLLRERGYQYVVQLAGGMKAWWASDFPVEKE